VVLQLRVTDAGATVTKLCDAGATVVFPLQEFCGERMARVRDPFGHLWLISQVMKVLSSEENQGRRDAFLARMIRGAGA
jgi:PhnB protein